ncbi:hypothetical protein PF003_g18103 [Phytophthora fragariae]|nr:hypothetical protein PF003_g18103 [Phytophthora fragariae]
MRKSFGGVPSSPTTSSFYMSETPHCYMQLVSLTESLSPPSSPPLRLSLPKLLLVSSQGLRATERSFFSIYLVSSASAALGSRIPA